MTIESRLAALESAGGDMPMLDASRLNALVRKVKQAHRKGQGYTRNLELAEKVAVEGRKRLQTLMRSVPPITYPDALPVSQQRQAILDAISGNQVVIVCGDTGSGKTTQLPKLCLELKRGIVGRIGCTQPRRLAATSVAKRVADELKVNYGASVGCQVRFDDRTSPGTHVKFMTDGILLAETQRDRSLLQYDTLIIDEAHERSLNIDFILGYLKNLLPRRKDLKVIISSATLDADSFSRFFSGAPIITVSGRTFPVEDRYLPAKNEDEDLSAHITRAVEEINEVDTEGDILVFLPGEREIRDCTNKLNGRKWANTDVLPLFARLSMEEQQRVFKVGKRRRIVLATNVAETSVTIPGIVYVIDSGVARISDYNPRIQVQSLQVRPISQASARQRRGRCGRMRPGICIRLYDEEDFEDRIGFTPPEIRRSSLSGVILQMKVLRLPDIEDFPFVDPPQKSLIAEGVRVLQEIGALDDERDITNLGRDLARFPVDPRIARMLYEADQRNALEEVLVIAAGLSVQDPRDRPQEKAEAADAAHAKWRDAESDFVSLLNLWRYIEGKRRDGFSHGKIRRLCSKEFVNPRRMMEWQNIHRELCDVAKQMKWKIPPPADGVAYDGLHKSILAGIPSNIGELGENREYRGARERRFFLFPGSGLFQESPTWIMSFALVETTKLYARQAAVIEPEWMEEVAPHLCKSRFTHIEWNANRGHVQAKEFVSCCGLTVIMDRKVHYGTFFPDDARDIFIRDGLAPGKLNTRGKWIRHHHKMLESIRALEHKMRRPGALLAEDAVEAFFQKQVPSHIHDARGFDRWRYKEEKKRPKFLEMSMESAMFEVSQLPGPGAFPDEWQGLKLTYVYGPGEAADGATVTVPVEELARISDWLPRWSLPGWREEMVVSLIKGLPKPLRQHCSPVGAAAREFLETVPEPSSGFESVFCEWLTRKCGQPVLHEDLAWDRVSSHIAIKFEVFDAESRLLTHGTDLKKLREELETDLSERFDELTPREWERSGLKEWPLKEIPAEISIGNGLPGYPALIDEGKTVGTKVFTRLEEAERAHALGVSRLFRLQYPNQVTFLEQNIPLPPFTQATLFTLGWAAKRNRADLVQVSIDQVLRAGGDSAAKMPRTRDDFEIASLKAVGELYSTAEGICQNIESMIIAYQEVSEKLETLRDKPAFAATVKDADEQVDLLFRPGWLLNADWVAELPRYLRAMKMRLERASNSPLKDVSKIDKVKVWQEQLEEILSDKPDEASLPDEIQHYASMLEELRISVMAPEVGTRVKVSDKRMAEAWVKVEGL